MKFLALEMSLDLRLNLFSRPEVGPGGSVPEPEVFPWETGRGHGFLVTSTFRDPLSDQGLGPPVCLFLCVCLLH